MPSKRSSRRKVKKFHCPFCDSRLWRVGSPKHHIFYQGRQEIRDNTPLSAKKAAFYIAQSTTYLDQKKWLESFYCETHGTLWMLISALDDGDYDYRLAKEQDWLRTDKTIDPRRSNPSVSEFTQRMSRKVSCR